MPKKLPPISEDLRLETLRFENPWWLTGAIDFETSLMKRRLYFDLFYQLVKADVRRAVVLMGPRRVGKTVLMHHSIEKLLSSGVPRKLVCFINIENPLYAYVSLDQLFALARKAVGSSSPDGWWVFFDEIQYLTDWAKHLKVLVDNYPRTKFIVSGSAAAALKLESTESGAGRFTDFMLPPLTFHEYMWMKNYEHLFVPKEIIWQEKSMHILSASHISEVNKHFLDYINYGGYPEVIFNEKIRANPGRYIKNDIVDKVLLRDLPSLYGIQNVQELNAFFTMLAYHTGKEVSLTSLSTNSHVNYDTLKKYLHYLEAAFLIKKVHRIDDTAKKFQRATSYKIYLTNPSLRSALFSPLKLTDELGPMIETAIYAQWLHRDKAEPYYANWTKGEVDLVFLHADTLKPKWAVEIKWSNKAVADLKELKSLVHFCKTNNLKSAIVTTIDIESEVIIEGIRIQFLPSSTYALTVGWRTLRQKQT